MNRRFRFALIIIALATVLLAADTAAWWCITTRIMAQAAAWQQARRAEGAVITAGAAMRAGWPLTAAAVLPNVTVAIGGPDGLAWQASRVRLVWQPWRPGQVAVVLAGPQTLRFGEAAPVQLAAGRLDAEVARDDASVRVSAESVRVTLAAGLVAADTVRLEWQGGGMRLALTGLALPGHALPFGNTVARLEVHARSSQPFALPLGLAAALARWRDSGGQLMLDEVSLQWGALDAGGHATLGLDGALQPEGAGTVTLNNFTEAIDALMRTSAITRNQGRLAQTWLGLLSSSGPDGAPQAALPFTVRGGVLSVGAIPLLRMPALTLP